MIMRIGTAVVLAAIVGFLLAVVLGPLLVMMKIDIIVFFGKILTEWGWIIGVLVGLWSFFAGGWSLPNPFRPKA